MSTRRKSRRPKLPALPPTQMEQDMGTPLYRAWWRLVLATKTLERLKKHCRSPKELDWLEEACFNAWRLSSDWTQGHIEKNRERRAAKEAAA